MTAWVALFRGINVGGHNKLPMRMLVEAFAAIGAEDIRTYIQSGNVVFRHAETDRERLDAAIRAAVGKVVDFEPGILLMTAVQFEQILQENSFPEDPPNALHVYFLAAKPEAPNLETLASAASSSEAFVLKDLAFYLHAPDGIARSKIAASVERRLGVNATARNWRTVSRVQALCRELA